MEGFGFMVWQLRYLPADPATLLEIIKPMGVKWLTIKVADGTKTYNRITRYGDPSDNDSYLKFYITELQDAGIKVRGWHWPYAKLPASLQGDTAAERSEKLDLDGFDIDIEGDWQDTAIYGRAKNAEVYLSKLHGGNFDVSLCSYRRPSYHPIPWAKFVNSEKVKCMTPQVYWQLEHNPEFQLVKTLEEYRSLTDKPVYPIGSSYGVGEKGQQGWWEPTGEDLAAFVEACKRFKIYTYGFYSLDYIFQHNRHDWLKAIGGEIKPPEVPPDGTWTEFLITCDTLNVRYEPRVGARVLGKVKKGDVVEATNVMGTDAWVQLPDKGWICVKSNGRRYAEPV